MIAEATVRSRAHRVARWLFALSLAAVPAAARPLSPEDLFGSPRKVFTEEVLERLRAAESPATPMVETYDVEHYTLDIEILISGSSGAVRGTMTMEAHALRNDLPFIVLDLDDALRCNDARVDGEAAGFVHANDKLRVDLPAPLAFGEAFTVAIDYVGTPPRRGFNSFAVFQHDGVPIVQTLSEPYNAHTWWPCKDRPNDKALATLRYTVPEGMVVGSNGLLVSTTPADGGGTTFTWETRYPIATYLVSLAATNYVLIEDTYTSSGRTMPITHYAFPEDLDAARAAFDVTPAQLAAFRDRFGEYPFLEEKYGMAEFLFAGAMEHQTLTSYGQGLVRSPNDLIVAHELAHHWWGDSVTLEHFRNIWLNEGFATYSEALWAEASQGRAAYLQYFADREHLGFPGTVYDPDPSQLFTSTTYIKGAFVLHMLRGVVGDETFFEILREYHRANAYEGASTRTFNEIAEAVAGRELTWFFDEWLRRDDRPTYAVEWSVPPREAPPSVTITIEQLQNGDLYRMPIPILLRTNEGTETVALEVDERLETFTVETHAHVDDLEFDPEGWVLKWMGTPSEPVASVGPSSPAEDRVIWASPNPLRASTLLHLGGAATPRMLHVFDASGRLVSRVPVATNATTLRWDAREESGAALPPGVYLFELQGDGSRRSGKLVLR